MPLHEIGKDFDGVSRADPAGHMDENQHRPLFFRILLNYGECFFHYIVNSEHTTDSQSFGKEFFPSFLSALLASGEFTHLNPIALANGSISIEVFNCRTMVDLVGLRHQL